MQLLAQLFGSIPHIDPHRGEIIAGYETWTHTILSGGRVAPPRCLVHALGNGRA